MIRVSVCRARAARLNAAQEVARSKLDPHRGRTAAGKAHFKTLLELPPPHLWSELWQGSNNSENSANNRSGAVRIFARCYVVAVKLTDADAWRQTFGNNQQVPLFAVLLSGSFLCTFTR